LPKRRVWRRCQDLFFVDDHFVRMDICIDGIGMPGIDRKGMDRRRMDRRRMDRRRMDRRRMDRRMDRRRMDRRRMDRRRMDRRRMDRRMDRRRMDRRRMDRRMDRRRMDRRRMDRRGMDRMGMDDIAIDICIVVQIDVRIVVRHNHVLEAPQVRFNSQDDNVCRQLIPHEDINPLLVPVQASAKDHSASAPVSALALDRADGFNQIVRPPSQGCDGGSVIDGRKRLVTLLFGSSNPIDLLLKSFPVGEQLSAQIGQQGVGHHQVVPFGLDLVNFLHQVSCIPGIPL
jgi:hypothetical protein